MSGREQAYVQEAFDTNWIAPLGPHVNAFEEQLENYNGIDHAVALSSGTAALHLAYVIHNIGPGDAVFCQSFTFCGSANPIHYTGATPVFIDSEMDSWNIDPEQLEKAIQACLNGELNLKPKAIVPVHLYGMPADMDAITGIAQKYDLPVIEDAAESLGSTYKGIKTGSIGHMGAYSFNGNKIITTSGGGALVTKKETEAKHALHLATQARDQAPHYQHSEIGFNYRMSNVVAGIGRGQMEVLDERIAQRRANFERYRRFFEKWNQEGFNIEFQQEAEYNFSNRWLTCITINPEKNNGLDRETMRLHLAEDAIEARPLWKPMHLQPVFKSAPFFGTGICERLFEIGLCLPSGSNLTDNDFQRIFGKLDRCFESVLSK